MKKYLLFGILFFWVLPLTSQAAEKSWHISNWQTNIQVNQDASLSVTDTVTFDFVGSFSFVTRTIDQQKFDAISDYKVRDEQKNVVAQDDDLTYDAENSRYTNTIHFSAQNESRTFTFTYKIFGALSYFEDHDELYWNILPSDRDVSIDQAKVVVKLPQKVDASKLQHAQYGEGENQTSLVNNNGEYLYSGNSFPASSNFTIVAGWPASHIVKNPGAYNITSTPSNASVFLNGTKAAYNTPVMFVRGGDLKDGENIIEIKKFGYETARFTITPKEDARETVHKDLKTAWWLIPFIVLVGTYFIHPIFVLVSMILKWRKKGRDPKGRSTIIAEYDAPDNLPPTMVGVVIDERVDMHEITASLIDLARRGYLIIKELPKKLLNSKDFELVKQKDWSKDTSLFEYEKKYLEALFSSKDAVKISDLKNKFYKKIPEIKKSLYEDVVKRGYFEKNPDSIRSGYLITGIIVVFIGVIGASFYGAGIPLLLDGVILVIFSRLMPKRTAKGVAAREHALGFKEYLYRAERYRVQNLTPELFEKFLPYAMIFKIEKEWAKKFEQIYKNPPSWYQSRTPFSANTFVAMSVINSVNTFSHAATTSFVSQPGSSGSSGFGGGGFSGGGGGGGGISAG